MSDRNLEIVQRIYARYADDPDAVRDAYASDFEFDVTEIGPDIRIVGGLRRGDRGPRSRRARE